MSDLLCHIDRVCTLNLIGRSASITFWPQLMQLTDFTQKPAGEPANQEATGTMLCTLVSLILQLPLLLILLLLLLLLRVLLVLLIIITSLERITFQIFIIIQQTKSAQNKTQTIC